MTRTGFCSLANNSDDADGEPSVEMQALGPSSRLATIGRAPSGFGLSCGLTCETGCPGVTVRDPFSPWLLAR